MGDFPCACGNAVMPQWGVAGAIGAAAGGSLDLAKAAKLLAEVGAADEDADVDLNGLDLAAADEEFLASAGNLIRSQAQVRA